MTFIIARRLTPIACSSALFVSLRGAVHALNRSNTRISVNVYHGRDNRNSACQLSVKKSKLTTSYIISCAGATYGMT